MKRRMILMAIVGVLLFGCKVNDGDKAFRATHLSGLYNGYYMGYYEVPNYYFYVGNAPVDNLQSPSPTLSPDATYYIIDLFAAEATATPITIPTGSYTFNTDYSMGTFSEYSRVLRTDSKGEIISEIALADGTMTVSATGITINATDNEGKSHYVVFEGSYGLTDASIEATEGDIHYDATNLFIRYIEDGNFYVTFGPNDFLSDGSTDTPSESYYFFSVYSDVMEQPEDIHAYENLPKGIYSHDTTDSCAPWTIDITDRAMYLKNNANGYTIDADYFSDATLVVSDKGVSAVVTTLTGKKRHHISYSFE